MNSEIEKKYFYISEYGFIHQKYWTGSTFDKKQVNIGNCFETDIEATFEYERLKVIAQMKKFASEGNHRYMLIYDCLDKKIHIVKVSEAFVMEGIYFSSYHDAFACCSAIGYERLKKYYFRIKETA